MNFKIMTIMISVVVILSCVAAIIQFKQMENMCKEPFAMIKKSNDACANFCEQKNLMQGNIRLNNFSINIGGDNGSTS